jgi:HSP20 family protein
MELVSKLKDMVPWRRPSAATREVVSLRDDINRLFDRFFESPFDAGFWPVRGGWSGVELEETEEEVIARAEVPGIDPKELDVTVRDGYLQIRHEHKEEHRNNGGYASRYGSFSRSLALPDGLDIAAAKAQCKNGMLTLRIPWTSEAKQRTRRIPVQS